MPFACLILAAVPTQATAADFIDWHPTPPALIEAAEASDLAAAWNIAVAAGAECLDKPGWTPANEPEFAIPCAGPFIDLLGFAAQTDDDAIAVATAAVVYTFFVGERAPGGDLAILKSAGDEVGRNEQYLRSIPFYDYWAQRKLLASAGADRAEIAALALEHAGAQLYATAAVLFERALPANGEAAAAIDPAWSAAFARSLIRSQRSDAALRFLARGDHGLDRRVAGKLRGWALMEEGRYDEADTQLRYAFGSGGRDREVDLLLARLLRLQGRPDEALPILEALVAEAESAVANDPAGDPIPEDEWYATNVRLARARGELGLAALERGDIDTARRELSARYGRYVIAGDFYPPDGAEYFAGLGDAETALGDCAGAQSAYVRALEIDLIFKGARYPLLPLREIMYRYCWSRGDGGAATIDAAFAEAWRSIAASWDAAQPQRIEMARRLGAYYLGKAQRPRLSRAFYADAALGATAQLGAASGTAATILLAAMRYRPVFLGQVEAAWQARADIR